MVYRSTTYFQYLTFRSSAITAYTASFALIHYRIAGVSPVEGVSDSQPHPWMIRKLHSQPTRMLVLEAIRPFEKVAVILSLGRIKAESGSRPRPPPLSLLKRCYFTTLTETALGFVLGLTGVLIYAWAGLSVPVGGFSATCLSVCVVAGIWAIA